MIQIPTEAILTLLLVVGAFTMVAFIFPDTIQTAVDARQTRNDVVLTFVSVPEITIKQFADPGYEYQLSMLVQGKYEGNFGGNTVKRIDVVPFVKFKSRGAKTVVQSTGRDYFTVTKDNPEFKEIISVSIITREPPIRDLNTNAFSGRLNETETIVLRDRGGFSVRLNQIDQKIFDKALDKIPFVSKPCTANFLVSCEGETKFVALKQCQSDDLPYVCSADFPMCSGNVAIKVEEVECRKDAKAIISVSGGSDFDIKENVYITFWNKGPEQSCVERATDYVDLTTKCGDSFLGDHEMEADLLVK